MAAYSAVQRLPIGLAIDFVAASSLSVADVASAPVAAAAFVLVPVAGSYSAAVVVWIAVSAALVRVVVGLADLVEGAAGPEEVDSARWDSPCEIVAASGQDDLADLADSGLAAGLDYSAVSAQAALPFAVVSWPSFAVAAAALVVLELVATAAAVL